MAHNPNTAETTNTAETANTAEATTLAEATVGTEGKPGAATANGIADTADGLVDAPQGTSSTPQGTAATPVDAADLPECGHPECANPKDYYSLAEFLAIVKKPVGEFLLAADRARLLPVKIEGQWMYRNPSLEQTANVSGEAFQAMTPEEREVVREAGRRQQELLREAEKQQTDFLIEQLDEHGGLPELIYLALREQKHEIQRALSLFSHIHSFLFYLAEKEESSLTPDERELLTCTTETALGMSEHLSHIRWLNRRLLTAAAATVEPT
jgi:hypothetical protein